MEPVKFNIWKSFDFKNNVISQKKLEINSLLINVSHYDLISGKIACPL